MNQPPHQIAVVGLGYVGLPLAVALARHFPVVGFDVDRDRIGALRHGIDRTREVDAATLRSAAYRLADDAAGMAGSDLFIVTVPTPVDADNRPDLGAVRAACRTVGTMLSPGAVVVFESTVYPGVTEDVCGPELEATSGLACGRDFFLGYSPERINPGDREHTVERISKVVAGQTPAVSALLERVYGTINGGNIFVARDIRTAEASKVIENAQRDINIAFINEVTQIFQRLDLSVHDVLEASATKWNFLPFRPGLVGGHCIGVDPYYLAHCAQAHGHHPEVILAGRRINDGMGAFIAERIAERLATLGGAGARVLVLGLTFKENVPDLRNSKVVDVIRGLEARGHPVLVHDPMADPDEAARLYGVTVLPTLELAGRCRCVVGAVAHDVYRTFTAGTLARLVEAPGLVADIKGLWRHVALPDGLARWQL